MKNSLFCKLCKWLVAIAREAAAFVSIGSVGLTWLVFACFEAFGGLMAQFPERLGKVGFIV